VNATGLRQLNATGGAKWHATGERMPMTIYAPAYLGRTENRTAAQGNGGERGLLVRSQQGSPIARNQAISRYQRSALEPRLTLT
jgi:hypothetical protein